MWSYRTITSADTLSRLACSLIPRFGGDSIFDDNWAVKGGAIFNEVEASIEPPLGGELVFQNLRGTVSAYFPVFVL